MNHTELSEAQQELLKFINPKDAPDICHNLRQVFDMALFENSNPIFCKQKESLFYLEKIIGIIEKI
jgi:hypothetical protein